MTTTSQDRHLDPDDGGRLDRLLTVREAAERLAVSAFTVYGPRNGPRGTALVGCWRAFQAWRASRPG